jgi:hypothetical protein
VRSHYGFGGLKFFFIRGTWSSKGKLECGMSKVVGCKPDPERRTFEASVATFENHFEINYCSREHAGVH